MLKALLVSLVMIAPSMYALPQEYLYPLPQSANLLFNYAHDPYAHASAPPMEDITGQSSSIVTVYTNTLNAGSHKNISSYVGINSTSCILGIAVTSAAFLLITYVWHTFKKQKYKVPYQRTIESYINISEPDTDIQVLTAKDTYIGNWLETKSLSEN